MAWRTLKRLSSYFRVDDIGYITKTTGILLGIVLYDKFRRDRIAYAKHSSTSTNDSFSTLSSNSSNIKWNNNWDMRDPKTLVDSKKCDNMNESEYREAVSMKTPRACRHLIFIRHGQYVDSATVDKERVLTALGREQATVTAVRLTDLDLDYTALVFSTMSRAVETADIVHGYFPCLPVVRDDVLCEGAPIRPEPAGGSWRPELYQFFQDGARIEAAFRKYVHRADPSQKADSVEIIVCHANVIRYFVCRALQFPPEAWLRMSLAHASITHLIIRPSGHVSLKCLGSAGHIPPNKVTFS